MVKLRIDKKEYEAEDGLTILEVAGSAGINIPTLCHDDNLPHYSSCMICMVKDQKTGNFIPSCSALIQDGMDIESSSDEVISMRRKAVELLMSEHRAECEAPCKVVCPGGYNIPLMNRLLSAKNFEGAIKLSIAQQNLSGFLCSNCPGYCENACRRKKIDLPVSIRNLQIFVDLKIMKENTSKGSGNILPSARNGKLKKPSGRFRSLIGRLEEDELEEWLKECRNDIKRAREITDSESAVSESESCMHCDCRAVDNCRLRNVAEEFSVKDPRGKHVNSPIKKKINFKTGLIFENAKCIKCGLCVRLCEESKEEPALCFINRGFISIISEPLTENFDNILKTKTKEVIEICPTGALSYFK